MSSYINISTNFSSHEILALTQIFNDIFNFKDKEGEALICAAYKLHGKINVFPTGGATEFSVRNGVPYIHVNFDEAARMVVGSSTKTRHLSLTSTIVHELFHAADPAATDAVFTHRVHWMVAELKKDNISLSAMKELSASGGLDKALSSSGIERNNFENTLRHSHLYKLADAISRIPAGLTADKIDIDSGINLADGTPKREQDAVSFTDAIMQKNYGPIEPIRGTYKAARLDSKPAPIMQNVPHLTGGEFCSIGFHQKEHPFSVSELHGKHAPFVKSFHGNGHDCHGELEQVNDAISPVSLGTLTPPRQHFRQPSKEPEKY